MRQSLVTSLLIDHFDRFSGLDRFRLDKYHQQAHFCAVVSRLLGVILDYEHLANLFTVSMLHNIGKLIIAVYFGEEYNAIVALKGKEGISAHMAERRVLGCSHAEISAMVLEKFNIPADLCQAVRYHDAETGEQPEVSDYQLMCILRESARIVDRLELGDATEPSELLGKMQDTVAAGWEECRGLRREHIQSKGYAEIFNMLLVRAAEIVERDLQVLYKAREDFGRDPEGHDGRQCSRR